MTISEKILAAHLGVKEVKPGDFIQAKVDLILGNDVTAPSAIDEFEKIGVSKVFDPDKIVLVSDHFTPNKDINSAQQSKIMREFARKYKITHYFEVGRGGIEHVLLPEEGLVSPGDLIIGADSHTCTYGALGAFSTGIGSTDMASAMATGECWFRVPESIKFKYSGKLNKWVSGKDLILWTISKIGVDGALYCSMEFSGEVIENLSLEDRFTICNMAIEAGAKNGIIRPDKKTLEFVEKVGGRIGALNLESDKDAKYKEVIEYDLSDIEPQVAFPHLPSNTKPISQVGEVPLDQVVIGSCTNGRISDLRIAAKLLKGKKVYKDLRLIILPATQKVYLQAIREGLIEIFIESEAAVSTPTCGPCLGGHMGVLAKEERCLATTNRNFVGRMGHPESEVYLCNPAVAAASAIAGKIVAPE
ncbi:MAG: 3-isopropylmalate dehydratase large subunit [Armatimonadetes bacterium CG07_land_8_20_14_0_80_40_9]|nr:MAG: 3-isopropylmalate dehydratase large subunit [Armatimonadetes bacterium CG07_land_8_20_14_0_80_40_9]